MSVPLILTILAGQPRLLARFSAFSGKTLEPLTGVFARICGGDHVAHLINGNASCRISRRRNVACVGLWNVYLRSAWLFWLDRMLPHAHPQDLMQNRCSRCQNRSSAQPFCSLSASVCITSRKGLPPLSRRAATGAGIWHRPAVALHNIPEGLAVAGPVYAATGSKRTAILWAGISGLAEILGGVLAWLILGSMISPVVMAAIMAAVAGIMVALSVDELMPLAKEIDPNNNPSYGVLCGMSVMGFSLVLLQTAGIG